MSFAFEARPETRPGKRASKTLFSVLIHPEPNNNKEKNHAGASQNWVKDSTEKLHKNPSRKANMAW
jgi:hypothetical protein